MFYTQNPELDAARYEDELDRMARLEEKISDRLYDSMSSALVSGDPSAMVETPAYGVKHSKLIDAFKSLVEFDRYSEMESEIFALLAHAAKSDDQELAAKVLDWMHRVSAAHAEWHLDDAE